MVELSVFAGHVLWCVNLMKDDRVINCQPFTFESINTTIADAVELVRVGWQGSVRTNLYLFLMYAE